MYSSLILKYKPSELYDFNISEYTKDIPKPMIEIKNKPILIQILKIYIKFGINNFIIATGYKNQIINNYFLKNNY